MINNYALHDLIETFVERATRKGKEWCEKRTDINFELEIANRKSRDCAKS